uniref:ATP synthase protein MI25 n=1 Tax=Gnetum gnemon TaxID=3382 RepID=A0A0N7AKC6_GNEGN|nr:ATPase subunit 4 [Gnetum gnemon]QJH91876.1 ATP synthase F0 subunit beta [Gnetum gnemon]
MRGHRQVSIRLFAAILFICVLSSKGILILNEETIVACCFIGFILFSQRSLGNIFKAILDGRRAAIQRELQQLLNPNEVVFMESNKQQNNLRVSLRSMEPEIVESLLGIARCAPKCQKTVQAVLCRNPNVELATLQNAISARRTRLRDDLVTGFHFSVTERFCPPCTTDTTKQCDTAIVKLIREGIKKVSRMGEEQPGARLT